MLAKQNDPISKEKKVNTTPINYVELNILSEDFSKRFVPQQELSDEQAFWFKLHTLILTNLLRHLSKLRLLENFLRRRMGMKAAVQQYFVDKQCFETQKKEFFLENDRLLQKITSQDVMICVLNSTAVFDDVNVEMQSSESCVKCLDLDAELLNKQNAYNDLLKSYSQLEKHCISPELTMQLNQEIFQKESFTNNQNALEIPEYFKNNDLKAQLQAKDTTICKLKEHIKSMKENDKEEKVKHEMDEMDTINIELEHIYGKCGFKTSNSRQGFCDTSLKNDLRKLKEKETFENVAQIPIATTIAPGMFKIDIEPLAPMLLNNREAHIDYLKHTQEQADILQGIVKQAKAKQPLDNALDFASIDTNLYTISLDDMLKTSPICLLSKSVQRLRVLWHRRKYHFLCSACALGKSKKSSYQPKPEDTNQEKLYLLHMDLCGLMHVESINGKKYILVIVDDYSRFTWVRFLRLKDEAPDAISSASKIISHKTLVARTSQQNDVVERQNQTLVEAARTMLIFSKAPLFLWAEAINTACYTRNRSLIHLRYNKTPYELMHNKKPDLSFLNVFGSLCYPTIDSEDLGKLNAKADIGIFVGYAPAKKAFRIYNRRTQKIMETIHVMFDELTTMASEQFGSRLGLQSMTPLTTSSGLIPNLIPQQPFPVVAAPRAVDTTESPVSTLIDLDALTTSIPSTQEQEHSPIIS
ncbi:retrovirus-related pol polyprotein from transposon TNT 1-94 [Tanacetum coccineum]